MKVATAVRGGFRPEPLEPAADIRRKLTSLKTLR